MVSRSFVYALHWLLSVCFIASGSSASNIVVHERSAGGATDINSFRVLGRGFPAPNVFKRDSTIRKTISLGKSWTNGVIYTHSGSTSGQVAGGNATANYDVKILCQTCYIKSDVVATLTTDGNFNASQALSTFKSGIEGYVENVWHEAVDEIESVVEAAIDDIASLSFENIPALPTLNETFNVNNISGISNVQMELDFNGLELYMDIELQLTAGATYSLNIYSSDTPIGFSLGEDIMVGVIFTVDLILSVDADVDISSGFHILMNDGLGFTLNLFEPDTDKLDLIMNGGQFEFLPVQIHGSGTITALLKLGCHIGMDFETKDIGDFSASGGVELGLYADIAEFATHVTGSNAGDSSGCELRIVEEYTLGLGAAAGATLALDSHRWGPNIDKTTAIFYTTLADVCAASKTKTVSATTTSTSADSSGGLMPRVVGARDNSMEVSTTVTYTGVSCMVSTINCPASQQATTTYTTALTTLVPSGTDTSYPNSTSNSVSTTIPFGTNAKQLASTSGRPSSYTPPPTSSPDFSHHNGSTIDSTAGVNEKLILGLSIGLGVPAFLALVTGCYCIFMIKRKKYKAVPATPMETVYSPQTPKAFDSPQPYYSDT
ncbi:hypothetical protein NA57DRAFT_55551 [Rhizodiscina lignyota]|uniref:Mid2 domain-containing protein n=1 Tax=Rhizodiscina lignyota TaxID=1504668 RepID=A0A9P4M9Q2_9PEZI|nr:hypothetical protein NA57DRAFT_55551 [Rhizodiscina lignyota]